MQGWPLAIDGAGDLMMLFTKKQEGFHEDHGAEGHWRFARNRITAGEAPESSFPLLRDGIESGRGTPDPSLGKPPQAILSPSSLT
jgi:hypothetical protein